MKVRRSSPAWLMPVIAALQITVLAAFGVHAQQAVTAPTADTKPVAAADAKRVFERIKALAGRWEGYSTKGWENREVVSVIGRGSAVMMASSFKDEPMEGMATLIHMDGERLVLTHYCEAGNQPRLVLSSVEGDGRQATFTFLDGTNLVARPGYMAGAVFQFNEDGSYMSRWSWHSKGKTTWFEDIRYKRQAAPAN